MKKNLNQISLIYFSILTLLIVACAPEKEVNVGNEIVESQKAEAKKEEKTEESTLGDPKGDKQKFSEENLYKAKILTQPTQTIAGRAIPGPPSVKITDSAGMPIEGVLVQVKSSFDDLGLDSIVDIESDEEGVVKFEHLIPTRQSSEHQLIFFSDKIQEATSFHFPVVHGHPTQIVIQKQPEDSQKGSPLKGSPAILLTDEFGNPTPNVSIQVFAESGNEEVKILSGNMRIRTGYDGTAVFEDLILPEGNNFHLRFKANTAGAPQIETTKFSVK